MRARRFVKGSRATSLGLMILLAGSVSATNASHAGWFADAAKAVKSAKAIASSVEELVGTDSPVADIPIDPESPDQGCQQALSRLATLQRTIGASSELWSILRRARGQNASEMYEDYLSANGQSPAQLVSEATLLVQELCTEEGLEQPTEELVDDYTDDFVDLDDQFDEDNF